MFDLKQTTQRRLFRVLFVLFCLVPTGAILAWGSWRHLPSSEQRLLQEISHRIGMPVTCREVERPRPGVLRLLDVELLDPETGLSCGRASLVEGIRKGGVWEISTSQAEIDGEALPRVIKSFHQASLCSSTVSTDIQFHVASLVLNERDTQQTLCDVTCRQRQEDSGPKLLVTFQLQEDSTDRPVTVVVSRIRNVSPPVTQVDLDSQGVPLPCSLIALLVPSLHQVGPDATYVGKMQILSDGSPWRGVLQGTLEPLELDRLVTDHFPHRLGGSARLVIQNLQFHNGRIVNADVELTSGTGEISRSLLESAAEALGSQSTVNIAELPSMLRYDRLACRLQINQRGLRIVGLCESTVGPAMLITESGAIVGLPERIEPIPVAQFVRLLVPDGPTLVTASLQSDRLLRGLPLPTVDGE